MSRRRMTMVSGDCTDYGKKDYPNESAVIEENKYRS